MNKKTKIQIIWICLLAVALINTIFQIMALKTQYQYIPLFIFGILIAVITVLKKKGYSLIPEQ